MAIIIDDKEYPTSGLEKKNKVQEHVILDGDTKFFITLGVVVRCTNDTQANCNLLIEKVINMLKEISVSQGGSHFQVKDILIKKEN